MDQTVLLLLFLITLVVGWYGGRRTAITLFGITLVLSVADFFHHATTVLTLSF